MRVKASFTHYDRIIIYVYLGILLCGLYSFLVLPLPHSIATIHQQSKQLSLYNSLPWQEYLERYGLREVWLIHPPNRIDLAQRLTFMLDYSLIPVRRTASFDHNTLKNQTLCRSISATFPDSTNWLLEQHLDTVHKESHWDIYGGWQSHLNSWERVSSFNKICNNSLPILIMEDDISFKPSFLLEIQRIINMIQNWTVIRIDTPMGLSLNSNEIITKFTRTTFGGCYLLRNGSVAETLYSLNNLKQPNIIYNHKNNSSRWEVITPTNWNGFVIRPGALVRWQRLYTKHAHDIAFSPL